jgi:hypothetical protein
MDASDGESDARSEESVQTGEAGESAQTGEAGESAQTGEAGESAQTGEAGESVPAEEATSVGGDSGSPVAGVDAGDGDDEHTEPTRQSAALRRQQLYVGVGGALIAGAALAVGSFQQFTDSPALAALAGLAGTALVLWLVRKSIFPGETATAE